MYTLSLYCSIQLQFQVHVSMHRFSVMNWCWCWCWCCCRRERECIIWYWRQHTVFDGMTLGVRLVGSTNYWNSASQKECEENRKIYWYRYDVDYCYYWPYCTNAYRLRVRYGSFEVPTVIIGRFLQVSRARSARKWNLAFYISETMRLIRRMWQKRNQKKQNRRQNPKTKPKQPSFCILQVLILGSNPLIDQIQIQIQIRWVESSSHRSSLCFTKRWFAHWSLVRRDVRC